MPNRKYWLFKSEPTVYSFEDLMGEEDRIAEWDGVRNYQSRNFMRDEMKVGDGILFYHTGGVTSVVGTGRIAREAYPDHTAWDPKDKHFDPKSNPDNPIWFMVDIQGEAELPRPVPLKEIKENPMLRNMTLVKASRLSVQPVGQDEFEEIVALGGHTPSP